MPYARRHRIAGNGATRHCIVQPRDFYIRDQQPFMLDRRHDFAQGRDVAPREDILGDERIGRGQRIELADRVEQGDAFVGKQVVHTLEEAPVMGRAHMLEHADGDDAVELALEIAIVAKLEIDRIRQTFGLRALLRDLQLFLA